MEFLVFKFTKTAALAFLLKIANLTRMIVLPLSKLSDSLNFNLCLLKMKQKL